jgi:hypothetical protein
MPVNKRGMRHLPRLADAESDDWGRGFVPDHKASSLTKRSEDPGLGAEQGARTSSLSFPRRRESITANGAKGGATRLALSCNLVFLDFHALRDTEMTVLDWFERSRIGSRRPG